MIPTVTKRGTLTGHAGAIYSLSKGLSPGMVLTAAGDHFLAQWNVKECKPDTFSVRMQSVVYSALFVEDKNILLIGNLNGSLHVIDLRTKTEIKNIALNAGGIFCIVYSSSLQKYYLSTSGGKLFMLDAGNFAVERELSISKLKLRSCCLSNDGHLLYLSDGTGEVHVFEAATLKHVHSFHANKLSCNVVTVHPSEPLIITGGRDAYLNIYDAGSYHLIKSIPAHNYAIYDIRFLQGTNYFATASRDKTVKLWDAHTFEFLLRINKEQFDGHTHSVNSLFWEKTEQCLVSAGDDRKIHIWNIR